jgi:hypothetical protein
VVHRLLPSSALNWHGTQHESIAKIALKYAVAVDKLLKLNAHLPGLNRRSKFNAGAQVIVPTDPAADAVADDEEEEAEAEAKAKAKAAAAALCQSHEGDGSVDDGGKSAQVGVSLSAGAGPAHAGLVSESGSGDGLHHLYSMLLPSAVEAEAEAHARADGMHIDGMEIDILGADDGNASEDTDEIGIDGGGKLVDRGGMGIGDRARVDMGLGELDPFSTLDEFVINRPNIGVGGPPTQGGGEFDAGWATEDRLNATIGLDSLLMQ